MNTLENKYDELEKVIYEQGLRIAAVHIHEELDLLLIVLNNKKVLQRSLNYTPRLAKATPTQRLNYQLIAKGVGIHWADIDEDVSLKGLLKEEITQSIETLRNSVAS